jgi:hypothetical protein
MSQAAQAQTHGAADVVRQAPVSQAPNGVCFAMFGENLLRPSEIEHMVGAVPRAIAAALSRKAFYFVPLAMPEGDAQNEATQIAERYDVGLSDRASCHRNFKFGSSECVFISTRVLDDKFSVAFEFFINIGHAFVEEAGVAADFAEMVWAQAQSNVRGETSLDAWELRRASIETKSEKERHEYEEAAFSDAIAVYLLSLFIDFEYYDLRERDYPLLAPAALAERLRKVNELFPANPGYEFAVFYRRK